jgi:hypothetical protein
MMAGGSWNCACAAIVLTVVCQPLAAHPPALCRQAERASFNSLDITQAQVPYSSRCATSAGICFVNPQPVNSICFCGQLQGVIIP